jgi:DNA-binding MarR family transcriptional regulator
MTERLSIERGDDARASSRDTQDLISAIFQNRIGYHLRVAQEASFQTFAKATGRADLKPGWYALLTVLAQRDSMTPSELSRICGRDRSTLTSSLKDLADRGLIDRQSNPNDQRSYSVRLTEDGRSMQERLQVIADAHDRLLEEIAGEDKKVFLSVLARLSAVLS